jgi:hypothetical protein
LPRLRDDIVRYGGDLKELEYQDKATLYDKEVAYEEERKYILEKLFLNLVTNLGLPLWRGRSKTSQIGNVTRAVLSGASGPPAFDTAGH